MPAVDNSATAVAMPFSPAGTFRAAMVNSAKDSVRVTTPMTA